MNEEKIKLISNEKKYLEIKRKLDNYEMSYDKYRKILSKVLKAMLGLFLIAFFIFSFLYLGSINQRNKANMLFMAMVGVILFLIISHYLNQLAASVLIYILNKKIDLPTKEEKEFYKNYIGKR